MSVVHEEPLYLIHIDQTAVEPGVRRLTFHTTRGDFTALAHIRRGIKRAVVELGEPGSGADGPDALFPQLAKELLDMGIASLRLGYRHPESCAQSALDVLFALQYLDDEGFRDIALVGWSFGGAVALAAGALAKTVKGIAAIATREVAESCLRRLSSRPLLLLHGEDDTVSPYEVSRKVYFRAAGTSRLIIYPGVDHSFAQARDRLRSDLEKWIVGILPPHPTAKAAATPTRS